MSAEQFALWLGAGKSLSAEQLDAVRSKLAGIAAAPTVNPWPQFVPVPYQVPAIAPYVHPWISPTVKPHWLTHEITRCPPPPNLGVFTVVLGGNKETS